MRKDTGLTELKAGHVLFIPSGPSVTLPNTSKEKPVNCSTKCYLRGLEL